MNPFLGPPKPLRTNDLYVLLALLHQPRHAYGIKGAIHQHSLGSINISEGSLSDILIRMGDEGLIEAIGERPTGTTGRLRHHYTISEHGKIRLQEEATRLKHVILIIEKSGILNTTVPTDIQRVLLEHQKNRK